MKSVILYYLILYKPLGYALAFLGMVIGGDETLFIASFLARAHFFNFKLIFLILLSGVFLGDLFWYLLGTMLSPEFSLGKWVIKIASRFDEHLKNNSFRTIFISKFTYGLNHATLIRAGMLGVSPRKFLTSNSLAILLWFMIIGWLGYFSGLSLLALRHFLRYTEIALLLGLACFLILESLLRYLLKKEL